MDGMSYFILGVTIAVIFFIINMLFTRWFLGISKIISRLEKSLDEEKEINKNLKKIIEKMEESK
ncbi:MAG: hypothetical protein Q7K48_00155 [Fusobacterium sp. JB021]|nr:hypothetical protein [Fusobacterium sp. JB021]MDP0506847.1 hypothetical protein [Fusobacterium sp. JB019]